MVQNAWEDIARRKQLERDAQIPSKWRLKVLPGPEVLDVTDVPYKSGILSPLELEITERYDAFALARAIADRKFKCLDVTIAFCKRAAIAQQVTNCLTEILFERAIKRAKDLDYHLDQGRPPLGPLHGVPVSVKDCFRIAGVDACVGYSALCFQPSRTTSPLVTLVQNAGAVIYCKTNVPQTMMSLDSDNPVFGRTLNPFNRQVTAGGSSGGEGALLGMKGSPLGIGTDIGGSIRIPAMCNGLFGLKPSANRVPYADIASGHPEGSAKLGLEPSAGPIARSIRDIELFMRTVSDSRPHILDPDVIPGTYNLLDYSLSPSKPKLSIGIISTDNLSNPLPPIAAVLKEVATALSDAGHDVIQLPTPPVLAQAQWLCDRLFGPAGNESIMDLIESNGDPIVTWLKPSLRRRAAKSLPDTAKLHAQRAAVMKSLNTALWRNPVTGGEIDAVVCPLAPHPVPPIDKYGGVNYTSSFVLLDCPAGTVPIRTFSTEDMKEDVDTTNPPHSRMDAYTRSLWETGSIEAYTSVRRFAFRL